jgi:rSAM/selenodomain-associated transferase 2
MPHSETDPSKHSPCLLSIIIPALNEADHLPALLKDLQAQRDISLEIIIGDGGSSDATLSFAKNYGVRWVCAKRGRGVQMNAAAGQASGAYYLFLHADSRIEDPYLLRNALEALQHVAIENPWVAGHFCLRFVRSTKRNALAYRYVEEKTASNREGAINGDQGLLLAKEFFHQLGGFDESLPFLEDQRMAEKIRSQGVWIVLPGSLQTSARRFEAEGFHRRYLLMGMMMGLHSIGELAFFSRAPQVYRVQHDTGRLLLSPFFSLIWRLVCQEWGLIGSARIFYSLGRYIRENSWQLFFFLDVWCRPLLGARRYPCLSFYDRLIAPCINFRIVNALTGLLCFAWYMGILTPYFWLLDFQERRKMRLAKQQHEQTE